LIDLAGDVNQVDIPAVTPLLEQGVLDEAEIFGLVDSKESDVRDVAFLKRNIYVVMMLVLAGHPLLPVLTLSV
jgi:hypothetical protein